MTENKTQVFIDETSPLSNKHIHPFYYKDTLYIAAENAFQASRFSSSELRSKFTHISPFKAEYNGLRSSKTREGWNNSRYDIMYDILASKFKDPELRSDLIATENRDLVVVNLNHETEWGVCKCRSCNGRGDNKLGQLLMQLRSDIGSDIGPDPDSDNDIGISV